MFLNLIACFIGEELYLYGYRKYRFPTLFLTIISSRWISLFFINQVGFSWLLRVAFFCKNISL